MLERIDSPSFPGSMSLSGFFASMLPPVVCLSFYCLICQELGLHYRPRSDILLVYLLTYLPRTRPALQAEVRYFQGLYPAEGRCAHFSSSTARTDSINSLRPLTGNDVLIHDSV